MKWVTRSHVHVDRVACPWLIQRFIDTEAEFKFVQWPGPALKEEYGTPFDFPDLNIPFTHHDGKCTFEVLLEHYNIENPILHSLASIIHGADVAKDIDLVPESRGVELTLSGLVHLCNNDYEAIEFGFSILDSTYIGLLLRTIRHEYESEISKMTREDAFQFLKKQVHVRLPKSIKAGE